MSRCRAAGGAACSGLRAKEDGMEKTALGSVYSLFPITREIIKCNGRGCAEFTKLAIVVLNDPASSS